MKHSRCTRTVTTVSILVGLFTTHVHAQQEGFAPPASRVVVAIAEARDIAPSADVSGTVVSLNDSRIASEVEGVLTWLANVGDAVDAGDVIARIDPRRIRITVAQAEANVAGLEADFRYRQKQLERTEELAQKNSASKTLLDEAVAQRDRAQHALRDAQATLERAQDDLERTVIRARFSGHITARLASVGEFVSLGEDVIRLVDTHRLEISLPASIGLSRYITAGLQVPVTGNGIVREHEVRTVVPVGDAVSRMVEVRLSATDAGWLVGSPVQVALPRDTPQSTVAVPRDALVERAGRRFVYRVTDDNTAEQITVEVNAIVGLWVGIADGIRAGDRVIVRGAERLSPGQAVEIIDGT